MYNIINYFSRITFNYECKVSDIISFISILLVMIGGIFGFIQWHKNIKIKKASYINELTEKIRSDLNIKNTVYMIDYEEEWYNKYFHNSGDNELNMDKTLSYFSYICYLKKKRIISRDEFKFFEYEVVRILKNNQVIDYLYNIYHYSGETNTPITFYYLLKYGEKNGFLDKDFFDSKAYKWNSKYHNYIEFNDENIKRNFNITKKLRIAVILVIYILLPLLIDFCLYMYVIVTKNKLKLLSIDGYFSYLGAVLGAFVTLLVLYFTLKNEKENIKEQRNLNIKPYLYCDLLNYDKDKWKIYIDNCINDYGKIEWSMNNFSNNIANNIKIIEEYSEVKGEKITDSDMDKYGVQIFTVLLQDNIFLPPNGIKIWKTNFTLLKDKAGEFIIKNGAFMFMHRIVYQYSDAPNDIIYKGMFSFEININIDCQGKAYFFVESINNSIIQ